jgi:hypothetical protein
MHRRPAWNKSAVSDQTPVRQPCELGRETALRFDLCALLGQIVRKAVEGGADARVRRHQRMSVENEGSMV